VRSRLHVGIVLAVVFLALLRVSAGAEVFPVNEVLITGPSDKRVNIVFLSEGYLDVEMGQFEIDVQTVLDDLFTVSPYLEYQNYFNVYTIEVPSQQSGTDHPGTAEDCPDGLPTFHNNTYFNATFDYAGIHRLLVARNSQGVYETLQDNLPEWDVIFIVVNTDWYGGSGGEFATFSMDEASSEIALHEMGHSFAGLADEYEYGGLTPYEAPNATAETVRDLIRWNVWIDDSTPVPTPETSTYAGVVGLFEGAVYHAIGWYRPKLDCKMRALGVPFCEICSEQTVLSVYNMVGSAIEGYEPALDTVTAAAGEVIQFVIHSPEPVPNTISTDWFLGGDWTAGGIDTFLFDTSLFEPGVHELTVTAVDTTTLVRNAPPGFLSSEITWFVLLESGATGTGEPATRSTAPILHQNYPNPFNPVTTISYFLPKPGRALLQVFDTGGREVRRLADRYEQAGEKRTMWDGLNNRGEPVASGVYFIRLRAGGEDSVKKMVLIR
jgi:hypothetical protein